MCILYSAVREAQVPTNTAQPFVISSGWSVPIELERGCLETDLPLNIYEVRILIHQHMSELGHPAADIPNCLKCRLSSATSRVSISLRSSRIRKRSAVSSTSHLGIFIAYFSLSS